MEHALLAHVKKQAYVALPQGLRFDPPCQRRGLVLALLFFVNIIQRTRGDGGSRLRQPDDIAAAVRFSAPCCVAGCAAELNVTAFGLVRGVTYRLLVVVARGGDAIYADETSITWSAEMAEKATPAGSHLFQRMLPPLPAGPHTVRATLLDAAADTTEDAMLSSMVRQLDPWEDRAAGSTPTQRSYQHAMEEGRVAGRYKDRAAINIGHGKRGDVSEPAVLNLHPVSDDRRSGIYVPAEEVEHDAKQSICTFTDDSLLSWSGLETLSPFAFTACSEHNGCVPVHTSASGIFFARFPPGSGSLIVRQIWRHLDLGEITEQTWDARNKEGTGCNATQTWVNVEICTVGTVVVSGHAPISSPEIQGRFDSLSSWQFSHIRFVGDSTMKRVFDAAVRAHCSRQISYVSSDKLHSDTHATCGETELRYIFSAGRPNKDEGQFYNTVKVLQSQPPPDNNTLVVFNAGKDSLSLAAKTFTAFAVSIYEVVKDWPHWIALTSPAITEDKVNVARRCHYNNVRVQMSNAAWRSVFPRKRVVDAFWSTLHSSKSADAMHYTDTEYDQIFHEILRQISLHAGTCRDYRKDLLAQNRSSCPGKFSHAVQHGVRSGTSDGIGFGIDPTCSLTWFDPEAACQRVSAANVLVLHGDSLIRQLAVGVAAVLSGDYVRGGINTKAPDREREECACEIQFQCYKSPVNHRFVRESGPQSSMCAEWTRPHVIVDHTTELNVRPDLHESLVSSSAMIVFVSDASALHNGLNPFKSIVFYEKLIALYPHVKLVPMTIHWPGPNKPEEYSMTQGVPQVEEYNAAIRTWAYAHNLSLLDTYPLTKGEFSRDGVHYDDVNVAIAQLLLNQEHFDPCAAEDAASSGRDFKHFRFIVTILTMNRNASLDRLLQSLEATDYDSDNVSLVIKVDHSTGNEAVVKLANDFQFSHGAKTVFVSTKKLGLQESWFQAWIPRDNQELGIILEDDVELAPAWYKWLKAAWNSYGNRTDLMGISLNRETRRMKNITHFSLDIAHYGFEIENDGFPFLYKLVGTWGFSPHPARWAEFLTWRTSMSNEPPESVLVPYLLPSLWWARFIQHGRTSSMWSQYMHFYVDAVKPNLFFLYANLPGKKTLCAHHRERGENHIGGEGPDFELAEKLELNLPRKLNMFGFDNEKITHLRHPMNTLPSISVDIPSWFEEQMTLLTVQLRGLVQAVRSGCVLGV